MLELLLSGGKRLPGSNAENLYIRPAELATLMGDLVKIINQDKEPRTDELVERYLTNRFTSEIEKEYMARFHRDLLQYAKDVLCKELNKLNRPQSESERTEMDERFKKEYNELKRKCYDTMICRTRCNILGRDLSLRTGFNDDHERQQAFHDLPVPIQHRLNIVESEMNNAREAQMLIEQIRTNLTVSDLKRQTMEKEKLLQQMRKQLVAKHANLKEEKRINKSLNRGDHWRVGVCTLSLRCSW